MCAHQPPVGVSRNFGEGLKLLIQNLRYKPLSLKLVSYDLCDSEAFEHKTALQQAVDRYGIYPIHGLSTATGRKGFVPVARNNPSSRKNCYMSPNFNERDNHSIPFMILTWKAWDFKFVAFACAAISAP